MKIIFDYWIVSVALKFAEIEAFQVIKKLNFLTPPHVLNTRLITQRVSKVAFTVVLPAQTSLNLRK